MVLLVLISLRYVCIDIYTDKWHYVCIYAHCIVHALVYLSSCLQLCMEAALECIRSKMGDIDVDADEIDAKVSKQQKLPPPPMMCN